MCVCVVYKMMCPLPRLPKMWRAEANACVRALHKLSVGVEWGGSAMNNSRCKIILVSVTCADHAITQYVFPELPDFSWSAGKEISSAWGVVLEKMAASVVKASIYFSFAGGVRRSDCKVACSGRKADKIPVSIRLRCKRLYTLQMKFRCTTTGLRPASSTVFRRLKIRA